MNEAKQVVSPPETNPATPRRSTVINRRRLVGVTALALAGGTMGGRVVDRDARTRGGTAFTPFARRRRLRLALSDAHAARLQPLLAQFEEERDTAIEVTSLPPGDLYELLAVDLLHETQTVDVASLSDDWIPSLGRSAVLMADDRLLPTELAATLDERVEPLGRSVEDDQLVAAPWTLDLAYTAIQDDLLGAESPPRRWGEFADVLQRSGTAGLLLPGASGDAAASTFRAVLGGYGIDIVEPVTNRPTVTDYDARRAMGLLRRLQTISTVSPLAVDDRVVGELIGRSATTSCSLVWASTWLQSGPPTGWTLLPALRASAPLGSRLLRSWMLAIPKTALDPDLAREFVAWMLAPPAQRSLLDIGLIPTSRAVLLDRDQQALRPAFSAVVRGLPTATPRPRLRAFPEINRVCGEAVAMVLAGNATAGVAFRAANTEMRRILVREGELRL